METALRSKWLLWLNRLVEYSLYLIVIALPVSNALLEIGIAVFVTSWFLKKLWLREKFLFSGKLIAFCLAFFFFSALSLINSEFIVQSSRALFAKTGKYLLLMLAVSDHLRDEKTALRLGKIFLLTALVMCLDGIVQCFAGRDLLRGREAGFLDVRYRDREFYPFQFYNFRIPRMSASLPAANVFASYLVVTLGLASGLLFRKPAGSLKNIMGKWMYIILVLTCLVFTFSRGALVSLAVCAVWLGFYRSKKIFWVMIPVMLVLGIFANHFYFNRAHVSSAVDPTVKRRMLLWQGTADMICSHPWLGHGLNTYHRVFPEYKPKELIENPYAHNSYLQMTAETGILGLLSFVCLLFYWFQLGLLGIRKQRDGPLKWMSVGIFAAVLALMINAFFDNVFFAMVPAVAFWFLLGYNLAIRRLMTDASQI